MPGWATSILAGPADESGQTLTFTVTNNNNDLFSVQPALDSSGNLTYTPAANFNGTDSFTYTVVDDGQTNGLPDPKSASGTVEVTVNAVNDVPLAQDQAVGVIEDVAVAITLTASDVDGDALTYTVVDGRSEERFSRKAETDLESRMPSSA